MLEGSLCICRIPHIQGYYNKRDHPFQERTVSQILRMDIAQQPVQENIALPQTVHLFGKLQL